MIYIVLIGIVAVLITLVVWLMYRNVLIKRRNQQQYDQLLRRYQEEVKIKLSPREEWLYNIGDIQSQLIFEVIDLLPEEERNGFKRRLSDLSNRVESTRYYDNQLKIEQPILENELLEFRSDLLNALQASKF